MYSYFLLLPHLLFILFSPFLFSLSFSPYSFFFSSAFFLAYPSLLLAIFFSGSTFLYLDYSIMLRPSSFTLCIFFSALHYINLIPTLLLSSSPVSTSSVVGSFTARRITQMDNLRDEAQLATYWCTWCIQSSITSWWRNNGQGSAALNYWICNDMTE